jgi:hypothetical protein
MQTAGGRSLLELFTSTKTGRVLAARDHVLLGKERHDVGAPKDVGYPIRGILKDDALYLRNFEVDRWPAGNPETGYLNCDGSPTKTAILEMRRNGADTRFWQLSFGKRPSEELYDLKRDPDCVNNLANDKRYQSLKQKLRAKMARELKAQGDPRMFGKGHIFDQYLYANPEQRNFYERFMRGEKVKAGWVNESDFEKEPIK